MDSKRKSAKYNLNRRLHNDSPSVEPESRQVSRPRGPAHHNAMGQLREYLDPNVRKDEDFHLSKEMIDKLRRHEFDSIPSYRSASIEFKEHQSSNMQTEQGQGTSILPNINQMKKEGLSRPRPSAAIAGLTKHSSLRIK